MSNDNKKLDSQNQEDNINKLSNLYNEGIKSKNKTRYNRWFNLIVTILTTFISICIGVIICYLIATLC